MIREDNLLRYDNKMKNSCLMFDPYLQSTMNFLRKTMR